MLSTINENLPVNLSDFELKESREENYINRTDHYFMWKRDVQFVEGEIVVSGKIQGNEPGEYSVSF